MGVNLQFLTYLKVCHNRNRCVPDCPFDVQCDYISRATYHFTMVLLHLGLYVPSKSYPLLDHVMCKSFKKLVGKGLIR